MEETDEARPGLWSLSDTPESELKLYEVLDFRLELLGAEEVTAGCCALMVRTQRALVSSESSLSRNSNTFGDGCLGCSSVGLAVALLFRVGDSLTAISVCGLVL